MKNDDSPKRLIWQLVLYVFIYTSLAWASRQISFPNNFAAVWLPSGFSFAVFAFTSQKKWWIWLLGSILSSLIFNYGIQEKTIEVTIGFTVANLSRTLLGASLLQWQLPGRFRMYQTRDILVFTLTACVAAPWPTGLFGSLTLFLAYGIPWTDSFPIWYFGNAVGMMIVAPITLVGLEWLGQRRKRHHIELFGNDSAIIHFIVLNISLTVTAIIIFRFISMPMAFLVVPALLWLIICFELAGAGAGTFLLAIVILYCTSRGYGPMAEGYSIATQMILSQLFITTTGGCALLLAVALQRSRRLTRRYETTAARLARLQKETQLILDTIPSMVFYKDANNRILRLNRSAARWLGLTTNARAFEEVPQELLKTHLSDDHDIIESGIPQLGRNEIILLPNGEKRWVQTDKMPLPQRSGEEPRVLAVLTDVTERKQMEEELQQSNQDLEQFAVIASHDLKEPIRAVKGYCQFLKEDYGDTMAVEAVQYIDKAIEGADRMTQMIDDLLEYSRVSRGEIEFETVDLNRVVQDLLDDLEDRIERTGAIIELSQLPTVSGSDSQLRQLLQNLLVNCLKFVSEGNAPLIQVTATKRDDFHVISISDNGLGIASKDQKRVFQIFQRLHRRSDFAGTGLGLAICDRIMQRHGGQIEVESVVGQGSTFNLSFPVS